MPKSFSKSLILTLIGLGVFSGCAAIVPPNTPLLYKNVQYNFQFNYPQEFNFTTPNYANLADKIVQLELPQSAYPKTNFGDANFYASAVYAKSSEECLKLNLPEGSTGFSDTDKVTINKVGFYETSGNGAGAGNFYESKIYRTYHNDFCFEIGETIHTSNIENYTPGTVTEVDKNPIWQKLDGILQSFAFGA